MEISVKNILLLCILILSFTMLTNAKELYLQYGKEVCSVCIALDWKSSGCYLCTACAGK